MGGLSNLLAASSPGPDTENPGPSTPEKSGPLPQARIVFTNLRQALVTLPFMNLYLGELYF